MTTHTQPINCLSINGFKSIKKLNDFKLNQLNVLIGSNGVGKSNFVSYFRMLGELVEGRLQKWTLTQGGADRILSFGIKETQSISSRLQFGNNAYIFKLISTVAEGFLFDEERHYYESGFHSPHDTKIGSGYSESLLKQRAQENPGKVADYCYSSISSWRVFHFHDTSETAALKRIGMLHDNDYLRPDASNLAAFLYKLKHENNEDFQKILKTIQLAIPFFDDFILEPKRLPSEEGQIRLLWRQKNSDYPLWPSQLSDGSLRFICLTTALLQPHPPATIIIDEPELGLHPYAITLLGALLRSASKRMQVIVSTQSVSLLNEFSVNDLIVVERDNESSTTFNRLNERDLKKWLNDYSIGELWEKNILGGRPSN